jgi:hypothetical protein
MNNCRTQDDLIRIINRNWWQSGSETSLSGHFIFAFRAPAPTFAADTKEWKKASNKRHSGAAIFCRTAISAAGACLEDVACVATSLKWVQTDDHSNCRNLD